MSTNPGFKTVLLKDPTIGQITDNLSVGVYSGAANKTYQQYAATTSSNSSIVVNAQIPSESIIISRSVLIRGTITFTISITGVTPGQVAFDYGLTDALQAFPLNSLFTTAQCTINNNSISSNLQDILPQLLHFNDTREMFRYNSFTPSFIDCAYANYSDAVRTNNNPLAGYSTASFDVDQCPRGSFPVQVLSWLYTNAAGATNNYTTTSTDLIDSWVITLSTTVTEPLFGLSPFTTCRPEYDQGGLTGITALSFNWNIDSTCKRLFSTASTANSYQIALGSAANAQGLSNVYLLMEFLSPQSTDLIKSKNVVPQQSFPRYLTMSNTMTPIPANTSQPIISQTIQLNSIPSLLIITVGKPMGQKTVKDSNSWMTIQNISVNFNNASSLLASAKQQDLYTISCLQNGCNQSWLEFSGEAYRNTTDCKGTYVPTTGSILVINPALDLSLPPYLSCGSLGSFQLSMSLSVFNQFDEAISPEICIITMNDGIFCTEMGSSTSFQGLLTKDMVLNCLNTESENAMSAQMYVQQVGGKLSHRTLAANHGLFSHMMNRKAPAPEPEDGGMAMPSSSGGFSAPAPSGGRLRRHVRG